MVRPSLRAVVRYQISGRGFVENGVPPDAEKYALTEPGVGDGAESSMHGNGSDLYARPIVCGPDPAYGVQSVDPNAGALTESRILNGRFQCGAAIDAQFGYGECRDSEGNSYSMLRKDFLIRDFNGKSGAVVPVYRFTKKRGGETLVMIIESRSDGLRCLDLVPIPLGRRIEKLVVRDDKAAVAVTVSYHDPAGSKEEQVLFRW